eukprot:TRINITY_DN22240_c3_g1_i2.p2 TRINITY_DN22240_c3_g1~~TRINITY_DN22240_c3_g1_i2.p2  ORF type:complete len:199 (+),score=55.76 TRINITY_DN22240_c3_g1_i2:81-599(+)
MAAQGGRRHALFALALAAAAAAGVLRTAQQQAPAPPRPSPAPLRRVWEAAAALGSESPPPPATPAAGAPAHTPAEALDAAADAPRRALRGCGLPEALADREEHAAAPPPAGRVAMCFFGLTRSLRTTYCNIARHAILPLHAAGFAVDTFVHAWTMPSISSIRSRTSGGCCRG